RVRRHHDACLRLTEEQGALRDSRPRREIDRRTETLLAACHRSLGERAREAAVAAVVRRRDHAGLDGLEQRVDEAPFRLEVAPRWRARGDVVNPREILPRATLG